MHANQYPQHPSPHLHQPRDETPISSKWLFPQFWHVRSEHSQRESCPLHQARMSTIPSPISTIQTRRWACLVEVIYVFISQPPSVHKWQALALSVKSHLSVTPLLCDHGLRFGFIAKVVKRCCQMVGVVQSYSYRYVPVYSGL